MPRIRSLMLVTLLVAVALESHAQTGAVTLIEPYPHRLRLMSVSVEGQATEDPVAFTGLCSPREFHLSVTVDDQDEFTLYCIAPGILGNGFSQPEGSGGESLGDCHDLFRFLGDGWMINWAIAGISSSGFDDHFIDASGTKRAMFTGEAVVFVPDLSSLAPGETRHVLLEITGHNLSENEQADDLIEDLASGQQGVPCNGELPTIVVTISRDVGSGLYDVTIDPPHTPTCDEVSSDPESCDHIPIASCHYTPHVQSGLHSPSIHDMQEKYADLPDPDLGLPVGTTRPLTVVYEDLDPLKYSCDSNNQKCTEHENTLDVWDYTRVEWEITSGPGIFVNKAQGSDQIAEGATALFRAPEGSEGQTVTIQVRIRDERPNGGVNSDFFVSPDQPVIIELEYELNRGNLRIDSNNDGLLDGLGPVSRRTIRSSFARARFSR